MSLLLKREMSRAQVSKVTLRTLVKKGGAVAIQKHPSICSGVFRLLNRTRASADGGVEAAPGEEGFKEGEAGEEDKDGTPS